MIAKSTVIKGRGGKSGGRAAKAVDLTSGDLRCVPDLGLSDSQEPLTAAQESAEGIVGGGDPLKARTVEWQVERQSRASHAAEESGRAELGHRGEG